MQFSKTPRWRRTYAELIRGAERASDQPSCFSPRLNPQKRGSISEITDVKFTPEHLIVGKLNEVVDAQLSH